MYHKRGVRRSGAGEWRKDNRRDTADRGTEDHSLMDQSEMTGTNAGRIVFS